MTELKIGDKAPAFTLEDQSGAPVALADFKGTPVFIFFFPS